jgi:hypothetical protein
MAGCGFSAQGVGGDGGGPATVGFLSSTSLQDELSGTVMVPVALDAPTGGLVTVHYRFSGGSAINGPDYQGGDNVVAIPPGATDAKIPITINPDAMEEDSETIEITLSDPTNAVLGTSRHTITISSDILPRVSFTVPTSASDETSSPQLLLALDVASTSDVSVDYVVNGTASAGVDYTLVQGTVAFPAGTTSKSIALPITDDALDEFDENVLVTLTSSSNVVVGTVASHDHDILDNDLPPSAAFLVTQQAKAEDTSTVEVVVQLSAASGKPISVDVVPGPSPTIAANLGVDYSLPATATLTFAPGELSKTFTVTLIDDQTDEFDEGFSLALANAVNVTPSGATDQITITDDDPLPSVSITTGSQLVDEGDINTDYPYVVTLSAASGKPIQVGFDFGGSDASNPSDYTVIGDPVSIAPGATTGTLIIRVIGDNVDENSSFGTQEVHIAIDSGSLMNVTRAGQNRVLTIRDDD